MFRELSRFLGLRIQPVNNILEQSLIDFIWLFIFMIVSKEEIPGNYFLIYWFASLEYCFRINYACQAKPSTKRRDFISLNSAVEWEFDCLLGELSCCLWKGRNSETDKHLWRGSSKGTFERNICLTTSILWQFPFFSLIEHGIFLLRFRGYFRDWVTKVVRDLYYVISAKCYWVHKGKLLLKISRQFLVKTLRLWK